MKNTLIKLLCEGTAKTETCNLHQDCVTAKGDCGFCTIMADHLIANGMTLQRWVPVSERLPAADFSDGEEFNICIAHYNWEKGTWTREVKTAFWSGDYFYRAGSGRIHSDITHWQTLPELPKEV